jgi:hypothetical protein
MVLVLVLAWRSAARTAGQGERAPELATS